MASQWEPIKWVPGTRLMVDGFRYQNAGCKSYLLTHFHSDHTTGLTRAFNAGIIFCTPITARLLRKDMGLPSERICEIPLDQPTVIEGTEVTPICANHCPGACMFLFKVRNDGERKAQVILHTGDMRWHDGMASHPALRGLTIDLLFMDTTYAKPTHTHPPQDQCIELMAKVMREELAKHPRTIFVCGSYHIGKERAYLGVAKLLGWKVWCESHKRRVLEMLDLPREQMACLTARQAEARIHVDFLGGLRPERLQKKLDGGRWTHAVAFRPTGWTFRRSGKLDRRVEGNVVVYGIPYSEHSSWTELRSCVALLRPRRLVPTVNASNARAARAIVNRFADLMDLSEDRSRLDFFLRKSSGPGEQLDASRDSLSGRAGLDGLRDISVGAFGADASRHGDCNEAADADLDCEGDFIEDPDQIGGEDEAEEAGTCGAETPGALENSRGAATLEARGRAIREASPPPQPDGHSAEGSRAEDAAEQRGRHNSMQSHGGLEIAAAGWQQPGGASETEVAKCDKRTGPELASPAGTASSPGAAASGSSLAEITGASECAPAPTAAAKRASEPGQPTSTVRADSSESCGERFDVDIAGVDVSEQMRILESIGVAQRRQRSDIVQSLARKKQATLAAFFGRS